MAAETVRGPVVVRIALDAELVVATVVSASGVDTVADVVAGIKWVVDHGARVVNPSLDLPAMRFAGAWRASGPPRRAAGSTVLAAGSISARWRDRPLLRIDPKAATPKAPPIDRKKVLAEVAVPRS
ncbi:MAG: hypothetical protein AB1679_17885 [Actinomycetota bacterium]